ncbi:MAG: BlaI/MecI/CopY family transcriptional regulator [Wenzhouxiangellaceae bacterium]|nr:BlaI/MecI/CopY family transcriptional regulator [Wenzhouxiangellaceae bacterium]
MSSQSKANAPRLGELESDLLHHLWQVDEATAKTAHEAIGQARGVSLNTIQSTLDRLYRKGLLARRKVSRAFQYSSAVTRSSLLAALVSDSARRFGGDTASTMSALVDAAEALDDQALDALQQLIEARRSERQH